MNTDLKKLNLNCEVAIPFDDEAYLIVTSTNEDLFLDSNGDWLNYEDIINDKIPLLFETEEKTLSYLETNKPKDKFRILQWWHFEQSFDKFKEKKEIEDAEFEERLTWPKGYRPNQRLQGEW